MTTTFSTAEIQAKIKDYPGWEYVGTALHQTFSFKDFSACFAFMSRVALLAESQQHHPDWSGTYNTLTLRIRTHDADGITEKDLQFIKYVSEFR